VGFLLGRASGEKSLTWKYRVSPTARLMTPIARYALVGEQKQY
jgi:hypothetical protein